MSNTRPHAFTLAVTLIAALAARDAGAEAVFASPPHFVGDGPRQQIVLFLSEAVSGALAARGPDGTFEVRVPRSSVAPAIQGQDFGADGWGDGGDAVRHLVLAAGAAGDTHIRLEPGAPIGGLDAHTADDPPRLVIELLTTAPTRSPAPVATRSPARSPLAVRSAVPSAAPKPVATKAVVTRAAAPATPQPTPRAAMKGVANPAATATAAVEPVAIAAAPVTAMILTAAAPFAGAPAGPAPSPRPDRAAAPASATVPSAPTVRSAQTVPSGPSAPSASTVPEKIATTGGAAPGLGCLWRRVAGTAFCAADPKAAAYAGDRALAAIATALARGTLPESEEKPAVETPALAYLVADRAFVERAPEGKLLPVIDAYRRALRLHPGYAEAWRARLNVALAYRAMEFRAELKTAAVAAAFDASAGLVRGLAGDLAVAAGALPAAEDEYRAAAQAGGVGSCLAARGRAQVALAAGEPERAAHELATLGALCPSELLTDPETAWVRAHLALANHDATGARAILTEIQSALGRHDQGAVIADLGVVAEAAGDVAAARKSYEQLVGGAYGARAARQATVRLALLDGTAGDLTAGLKRLERLTPEAADPARRALVMQAARSALQRGDAAEAIATLHEAHVDPTTLALDEQLVVAQAYRGVGLTNEAVRVLAAARVAAGPHVPAALFAECGALALARRDGPGALAVADEWMRVTGRNAGALALRAQATAAAGDGVGTQAAVAAAVIEDPTLARTLALEAAEALRDRAPAAALGLASEALAPGPAPELPAPRAAAGLALIGALAEAAGDEDTALAAFTTLTARYGTEPVAADAAYRAARVAARRAPGNAAAAYDDAAHSKDVLARRVAGAARDYETIVRPLNGAKGTR